MQADSQASQSSCMPGQSIQTALQASSQYAAPTTQAMHTDNITSNVKTKPPEEQQENQSVRVLPKVVAGPIPTAEDEAEGTCKQSSLGKQLGDALRLRNWRGLEASAATKEHDQLPSIADQANPSQIPHLAQTTDAMVLSPRTESAMLIGASELGFDAEQDSLDVQSESWRLTAAAQPPKDPASRSVQQCLTSASTHPCCTACQLLPIPISKLNIWCSLDEEEGLTSSANHLGCTHVPGPSINL